MFMVRGDFGALVSLLSLRALMMAVKQLLAILRMPLALDQPTGITASRKRLLRKGKRLATWCSFLATS